MSDVDRLLARASEWRARRLAIATVIATWGSAPRPIGSHMLVSDEGKFEGSVSGGCVEGEVLRNAAEVIAAQEFRRLRFGVTDAAAWDVGLPCGGEIEIMVQPVSAAGFPADLFDRIAVARGGGETLCLVTDQDGRTTEADGGGEFINVYRPRRRVLIVGAVQIAQTLAPLTRELDMDVTIIDPRTRFLTEDRFPGIALDHRWPGAAIEAHRPTADTAVITLSHDIKLDDPALAAALHAPTGYIAALGSRRSHAARLLRLAEAGFDDRALIRIQGPAGLDIGAVGPAEIALSIAAGIVQAFSSKPQPKPSRA